MASGFRPDDEGSIRQWDDALRHVVTVRQALDDEPVSAEALIETTYGWRRRPRCRRDDERCNAHPEERAIHRLRGRAAPKKRPASLLTKPIRSNIASSVGSEVFRAFSAPRASSRCSSAGSARSS